MCRGLIVKPLPLKIYEKIECMETSESIYEGFMEPSYNKNPRSGANCASLIGENIV